MRTIIEQIRRARRAGTPLLAIETPDQTGLVAQLRELGNGSAPPILEWNCIQGIVPRNEAAKEPVAGKLGMDEASQLTDPTEAVINFVAKVPRKAIMLMANADLYLDQPGFIQALSTCRDVVKSNVRTIILAGTSVQVPAALRHDTITLREPLPDDDRLLGVVRACAETYNAYVAGGGGTWPHPGEEAFVKAAADLRGLSAFAAEQAATTALMDSGSFDSVHEERNNAIDATPGLSVDRDTVTYSDMRGCERAIEYMTRLCQGPESPQLILRIDEIEKKLSGSNDHDRAGATGADELQMLLQMMEDHLWSGVINFGHPGTAKSMFCKATGPTFGIPSIALDLGATRGKYVGESEQNIRAALETVRTIGGSRVHVMATCNELNGLPPELRRRFTDGIMFYDLPSAGERALMWSLYATKYSIDINMGIEGGDVPDLEGLTGAEIRNICRSAYRMDVPLHEAARDVVPVVKSDPKGIERRRRQAHGCYRSAATPGVYQMPSDDDNLTRELGG